MRRGKLIGLIVFLLPSVLFLFSCKDQTMKLGYSGKDLTKEVVLERNKDTKVASLKIFNNQDWILYAGNTIETIDLTTPFLQGTDDGVFAVDVPTNKRSYFQIATPSGTALLAERQLPMSGGYNFRDLGGFRTKDGRYTKWGKIFRSDDLHNLTDSDLEYLSSIPLVSIVDFRSQEEINVAPDRNPSSLKNNYKLSISPGNILVFEEIAKKTESEMEQMMMELNENLVTESSCLSSYKEFFALLQSDAEMPLMFHCSAGKDRTGMAGALILYALGVDEETILNDYMSSNDYLGDKYAPLKEKNPSMTALFEVRSKYLKAGLDKINTDHGSVDNFLTSILSVDIEKMREKYLY